MEGGGEKKEGAEKRKDGREGEVRRCVVGEGEGGEKGREKEGVRGGKVRGEGEGGRKGARELKIYLDALPHTATRNQVNKLPYKFSAY